MFNAMEKRVVNKTCPNDKRISLDFVDATKFIGSVLIFSMHCNALGDIKYAATIFEIIARWSVPFFFMASSYFLFGKSRNGNIEKEQIKRYVYRISMLYLCWFVFNIPSIFYIRLYQEGLSNPDTWLAFLKNTLLSSSFTGSWYLVSSIFSAYIVWKLSGRFNTKQVIVITSVLYILCVLSSVYKGALPSQMVAVLDFLCFPFTVFNGCFYFSIGKYVAEKEAEITELLSKKKAFLLFVMFYLIYVAELLCAKRFGVLYSTDVAFSTAIIACALFVFVIQVRIKLNKGKLLRKLSVIIYCCQGNVLVINTLLNEKTSSSILAYAVSALLVALISIIVLSIQKRKTWKWSQYLT